MISQKLASLLRKCAESRNLVEKEKAEEQGKDQQDGRFPQPEQFGDRLARSLSPDVRRRAQANWTGREVHVHRLPLEPAFLAGSSLPEEAPGDGHVSRPGRRGQKPRVPHVVWHRVFPTTEPA